MTDAPQPTLLTPDGSDTLPWTKVEARLANLHSMWLATLLPDGRPHVRPVLTIWMDGLLHTATGPQTRKGRNLAADGRCSFSGSIDDVDLVVEGTARWVTDTDHLQRLADAYRAKYGWPPTVVDGAFDAPYGAPTAGPPPYRPVAIAPTRIYAFGVDDELAHRCTRFDL